MEIIAYYAWKEGDICKMGFCWKDERQFYKFAYFMKAPTIVIDNNNPLVAIPSPRIANVPMVIVDYSSITNTCADAISRFPYKLSKLYVVNIFDQLGHHHSFCNMKEIETIFHFTS